MNYWKHVILISMLAVGIDGCSAPVENTTLVDSESKPVFKASLPAGTHLTVVLMDSLDTDTNVAGDTFVANLVEPVIVDGATGLEKGTIARGRVVDVQKAGRESGHAKIRLVLTEILSGDKTVAIITNEFSEVAGSTRKDYSDIVAGGADIGGAFSGGLSTDVRELYYGPDIRITFTLARSVELGP